MGKHLKSFSSHAFHGSHTKTDFHLGFFVQGGGEGGKSILKKKLEPRSTEKKIFGLLGVRGHASPEKFEKIVFGIG